MAIGADDCAAVDRDQLLSVRELILSKSGISQLRVSDFAGLSNLETLNLSCNRLTDLPPEVFNGLSGLKELYLSGAAFCRTQNARAIATRAP